MTVDSDERARALKRLDEANAEMARRPGPRTGTLVHSRNPIHLEPLTDLKVMDIKAVIENEGSRWLLPADEPLIVLTARNLVILDQLWSYMLQRGAMDTHGRPRGAMKIWQTINNVATRQLVALGLGPLARAELGANLAGGKRDLAMAMRIGGAGKSLSEPTEKKT